ncbi:MAG: MerR family transcriptional regulator [Chloroflexota bacterium]
MESTRTPSFYPGQYADVPLYNIQAVAAATRVPAITLRSWERRYGVPVPQRDPKGYRLYSERDIALARWLRERVEQGIGISRAVNMLRVLEGVRNTSPAETTLDLTVLRKRMLAAIARLDEPDLSGAIQEALMVAPVEDVALRMLQPALYELGDLWSEGRISVTCEHFGSNVIRAQLEQLMQLSPKPIRHDRVLIGCAPGELHEMGALMLALFLKRRGFSVLYAGANVELESFVADTIRLDPAAVLLSASSPSSARSAKSVFRELLGQFEGRLTFGGRSFNEDEQLVRAMPGTFLGRDASEASEALDALIL